MPLETEDKKMDDGTPQVALCASCDRCRSRKTKCDGKRPCGNCAGKYMKKNKLTRLVLMLLWVVAVAVKVIFSVATVRGLCIYCMYACAAAEGREFMVHENVLLILICFS